MKEVEDRVQLAVIKSDTLFVWKILICSPVFDSFINFMCLDVFRLIRKQFQIFKPVISSNPVYMMNDLFFAKKSAKFLFHYKSMFVNILTDTRSIRMMRLPDIRITSRVKYSSTLIVISRSISTFMRTVPSYLVLVTNKLLTTINTFSFSMRKLGFTFNRTKGLFIAGITKECPFTIITDVFNHLSLSYNIYVVESI